MLEPVVRPGASGQVAPVQGRQAFEKRSFEDLLSEASGSPQPLAQAGQAGPMDAEDAQQVRQAEQALNVLGGFGSVENAALRSVLAKADGSGGHPGKQV